jgi:hypothetical protein
MSAFAKDLGDLTSLERLHSTRLDANAESVLYSIKVARAWVSPNFLSVQTILPLDTVLASIVNLRNAGFVAVRPASHTIIEAAPANFAP